MVLKGCGTIPSNQLPYQCAYSPTHQNPPSYLPGYVISDANTGLRPTDHQGIRTNCKLTARLTAFHKGYNHSSAKITGEFTGEQKNPNVPKQLEISDFQLLWHFEILFPVAVALCDSLSSCCGTLGFFFQLLWHVGILFSVAVAFGILFSVVLALWDLSVLQPIANDNSKYQWWYLYCMSRTAWTIFKYNPPLPTPSSPKVNKWINK